VLYQVQIQGYIVWYKNKIKEGSNITNRLNGFIFTYNDELGDFKCRLAQSFQAYNQVADLIEKDFPQEYNFNGKPIYSEKMQCVVNGTIIPIKTWSKTKKRYAITPTLRIDRIYHIYRNHQELVENLGYDKNDEIQAELDRYTTNVEDEVSFDEQEFDMLERK